MTSCPVCQQNLPDGVDRQAIPPTCPHCGEHVLGEFVGLEVMGHGAMGWVLSGWRSSGDRRRVAIKVPKANDPEIESRFLRERAALEKLNHPNIVRTVDHEPLAERPLLVMEFVVGQSLSELIKQSHPLPVSRVIKIMNGVASALRHAADQGVVHRDVKPDNILVASRDRALLMDWGLALLLDTSDDHTTATRSGTLLGSPSYMAPEQARDPHSVTASSDVYGWACTGYCALVGSPPFAGSDSQQIVAQHLEAPRPRVSAYRRDIPVELDDLLFAAMANDPRDRPDAAHCLEVLDRLACWCRLR